VAAEKYPDGLPEPESDDPTQWLFHGRPEASEEPMLVAVARLLGYRWPAERDPTMRLSARARELVARCDELLGHADADGVVAIPPLAREEGAAERVRRLLADAFGDQWDHGKKLDDLLAAEAEALKRKKPFKNLEDYLRNGFYERHAKVFHNRPFVWHLWDGEKDGFGVLVNAHKLCDGATGRQTLSKIIYTHLGEWIRQQDEAVKQNPPTPGAEKRLSAASGLKKKLELILEGGPPYDVFVRWKPLSEQAIGWEPDVDDGVRMNIRPFVEADVLRKKVTSLKWTKDRGKEPKREPREEWPWFYGKDGKFTGERINDVHLSLAEKRAARERAKAEVGA
jgi:hypothetical protein